MSAFIEVGSSRTSPITQTQRTELQLPVYVGQNGYVQNAGFIQKPISALEKGALMGPVAVVLHRTDSYNSSSVFRSFQDSGIGTHFVVDKDGVIYQTASLQHRTWHVGKLRSRCRDERSCGAVEAAVLARMSFSQTATSLASGIPHAIPPIPTALGSKSSRSMRPLAGTHRRPRSPPQSINLLRFSRMNMACRMATFTSTTRFLTRPTAKALVFTTLALSGCHPGSKAEEDGASNNNPLETSPFRVLRVGLAAYTGRGDTIEEQACRNWRLNNAQVEHFFALSRQYGENPYQEFYQMNCSISGELQSSGVTWSFKIDGGGTATWRSGHTVRYWGCSAQDCEPLVILLTDGMKG